MLKNIPIQKKLTLAILITSGAVFLLTTLSFFAYEFFTFRQTTVRHLSTLGEIIADNSTATLAFDDSSSAAEILLALRAERHIVSACIYNQEGNVFAYYTTTMKEDFPSSVGATGFRFNKTYIEGFLPIHKDDNFLGNLYLKSDTKELASRLKLYLTIALIITLISFVLAYFLSRMLQRQISKPILALAGTVKIISYKKDYSVRADKYGKDEIGTLSDGFNNMLDEIEKMERSLRDSNRHLEQRVAERTKELETVNRELEAFSYSVSHDLKAPLRIIQNYSGMMKEAQTSATDTDSSILTDRIIRSAQKMNVLIDDMLSLAHVRSAELNIKVINMNEMIDHVINEARNLEAKERIIQTKKDDIINIYGDQALIRQVVSNLIFNAFKYTRKKDVAIINIGSFNKNNEITYYIKDNGAGFDMAYEKKLFNEFQRLHSGDNFEGTGVGLAIVKRIITKHKGRVWAEGKVNEGATFYFAIPVAGLVVNNKSIYSKE